MLKSRSVIRDLEEEQNALEQIIRTSENEVKRLPEGTVQIKKYKDDYQFFHRKNPHDKNGQYIRAAEKEKAVKLVQKRYLSRIIKAAEKQKRTISLFLREYDPEYYKEIYNTEGDARQKFLAPVILPDDQYAEIWQNTEYKRKGFKEGVPEHYTQKQERVRSKSEVIIADALNYAGIPYKYECPLFISGRIIHPDFTILRMSDRKEIFWEHLGQLDSEDYCTNALRRIRDYEAEGIFPGENLIITAETEQSPMNARIAQRFISHYIT